MCVYTHRHICMHVHIWIHVCKYLCMYIRVCACAYLVAGLVVTAGVAKEEGARAVKELDATAPYGHVTV